MKQLYRFDEHGYYIEPVIIEPDELGEYHIPEDCTDIELPQPNYKPKFNKDKLAWDETVSDEELDDILNPPVQKTEIDILKEKNEELENTLKELENAILELTQSSSFQESDGEEMEDASLELTEIASHNENKANENEEAIIETTMLVGGLIRDV